MSHLNFWFQIDYLHESIIAVIDEHVVVIYGELAPSRVHNVVVYITFDSSRC